MKKVIAMAIALTVIGGAVCTNNNITRNCAATVYADEIIEPDEDGIITKDGVKYKVFDDSAWIIGYTKDLKGDLVIPEKVNGLPVTHIDDEAFANCAGITSVTLPETVKTVGLYAFKNCEKLKSADIKSANILNPWTYGPGIFTFCPNLEKVTCVTDEYSYFKVGLFGTSKLSADDYDADKYTYDESHLHYVLVPKSLKTVEITESTAIAEECFKGITSLETVHLPNSLETIGEEAFSGCKSLTSVIIPESVTNIETGAFSECANLVSVEFEGNIVKNADSFWSYGIFSYCPKLEKVTYKDTDVESVAEFLFGVYNDDIKNHNIDDYVLTYSSEDDKKYANSHPILNPKSFKTIEMKEGKIVKNELFKGLSTVENIILPDKIEFIGAYAFSDMDGLTSVKIPASVLYIGEGAFSDMDGLTSVKIPASVLYIGNSAFSECDNLTSAEFEGSYYKETDELKKYCESNDIIIDYLRSNYVGYWKGIFLYCPKLEKVSCKAENDCSMSYYFFNYGSSKIDKNDTIPDDYMVVDYDYAADHRIAPIIIPKSFKTVSITGGETISENCFSRMKTLETISLPDSIKKIEHSAFYQCNNLKSIDIPESVTFIGDHAFSGCSSIEKLELPEKLETIGHGAFGSMDSLTSAKIPASVKTIGYNLFSACKNLRSLKIDGTPVISSKSETWIEYYDEMSGMVVYCPNFEKFETASDTFKWIDKEDVEHEITAKQAMFTYDKNWYYEIEDMYTAEGDLLIPKSLKTGSSDKGDGKYGDANLDGNVDISDAVLIMQSISNPSKYQLSSAAKTLSDVTGNSDGVTNKDALAIQRYLLKLVDKLPE